MKRTVVWKNRFILVGMVVFAMLFISACSGDEYPQHQTASDPTTPWAVTATEDIWLTSNPYEDKHDGGWVYSAREDVFYAIYGQDNNGRTLYRIDHIGQTSTVVATSTTSTRHGSQPVIDDTGTYIYLPPSESDAGLERYNTVTGVLTTLNTAPDTSEYSHAAWKNGKLWIVLDDDNLYSYDPTTDAWSAPLHDFGVYANVASSGPSSNLIYVLATDATFYSYDVTTGVTTPLDSHPNGFDLGGNNELTWFGTTKGFIYAAENYSDNPAIYDIANGTWQQLSDPKAPDSWAGHATYDSKRMRLYVTGASNVVWYYQY